MPSMFSCRPRAEMLNFLLCLTVCTASKIIFETEPKLTNMELFVNYEIGTSFPYDLMSECATVCSLNSNCSLFGVRDTEGTCQMFSDAVPPVLSLPQVADSVEYFLFKKAGCPIKKGFMWLRQMNACVRLTLTRLNYTEADGECQSDGGRLAVLEDADIANALPIVLEKQDFRFRAMYVGARKLSGEEFQWVDGRAVSLARWKPSQPLSTDEGCAILLKGGLYDKTCNLTYSSLCEMLV